MLETPVAPLQLLGHSEPFDVPDHAQCSVERERVVIICLTLGVGSSSGNSHHVKGAMIGEV